MVPIVRLFRNLPALFALVCATTGQGADPIYRKVGDSVVLNPGQPFNAISSATWKHNTDLASEWFGTGNVDCYRDFKGRCSLNKKDGSFTISNLKVEDSGSYTPEINDKVLNQLELQVIEPVPKPTVSVKCNYEKTLCNLTCEANINPDVGTVKYEWRTGEVVLSNNKELIITENKESSFICMLKNRVSSSSSDGVDNPLSRGNPGAAAGLAVAIVILIVAPALAVIGRLGWYWFKNRKFPTWNEFWCCGKKKAKEDDSESAEVGKKLLHDASEKSDLEAKIYKDQETNAMRPTETLQIVNENGEALPGHNKEKDETNISVSGEEHERLYDARETQTSGPTEDKDSPNNEKKNNQHQKSAEESPIEKQGHSSTEKQTTKASETNISGSGEEDEQNHPAFDRGTIVPTEGEAPPGDNEEQDEISQVGDNQQAKQSFPGVTNKTAKDEDDAKSAEETNISGSGEEDEQYHPASETVINDPTEGEASPSYDKKKDDQGQKSPTISASENPGEEHQDLSPEEETRKQDEDDAGSAEEGEASLKDNEEKDDQHQKSPTISANENPGEEHQDLSPEEKTRKQSEGEASPSGDEGTEDLGPKLPTIPANENPREQHRHLNPEGETRNQSEINKVGDNQQGKQLFPGVTSKTANDETNISESAEKPKQFYLYNETPTSDVKVSSSDEEKDEDKDSPNNCKKTDDQDKDPAEDSSSENQVEQHLDSNPKQTQHPNDGTENTSETPSGPKTSEQVSADQDQS